LGLESIEQLFYIQFLILNLKKLFSEAEKKNKVENFVHFEKDVFFSRKTTPAQYFVFFYRKEVSAKAKK
jgi:hypothetical protein